MKKFNLKKVVFIASLCLFTGVFLFAQEKDNKKVYIKVKKDDATTVDTSFTIDEDMDKDEIRKMIHELTGTDIKVHHGETMSHMDVWSIKDSTDCDLETHMKKMDITVTVDGDEEKHVTIHKHGDIDHKKWVDHKSGTRYIIVEDEDGKKKKSEMYFISKESKGDEKEVVKKVIHSHGDTIQIIGVDIEKDKKGNVLIMKKEDDNKNIIILESSEKPIHFRTKDGKELELVVKDKKSGTDIALDKVKVIKIEKTEDGVINIVVSDKKK